MPRTHPPTSAFAAALLSTIPVALLFLFFQRHFIRGANAGAVRR